MAQYYHKKDKSGYEFVDTTTAFCDYTVHLCQILPKRWNDYYLKPLAASAFKIEDKVIEANAVFLDLMNPIRNIEGLSQRDIFLAEALREFDEYDRRFDRLMRNIDFLGSEVKRMNAILYDIINHELSINPDTACVDIRVHNRISEVEYTSVSGKKIVKMALTPKKRDRLIELEEKARSTIAKRLSDDKSLISRLKQSLNAV